MTREELLQECFGRTDFAASTKEVEMRDEATGDVQAHLDLYLRRLLVRNAPTPGTPLAVGATTLVVAQIANLCTAPDHRGKGFAKALVRRAHSELDENKPVAFSVVRLEAMQSSFVPFFAALGYSHPEGTPDGLLVHELRDEPWPSGRVSLVGAW